MIYPDPDSLEMLDPYSQHCFGQWYLTWFFLPLSASSVGRAPNWGWRDGLAPSPPGPGPWAEACSARTTPAAYWENTQGSHESHQINADPDHRTRQYQRQCRYTNGMDEPVFLSWIRIFFHSGSRILDPTKWTNTKGGEMVKWKEGKWLDK